MAEGQSEGPFGFIKNLLGKKEPQTTSVSPEQSQTAPTVDKSKLSANLNQWAASADNSGLGMRVDANNALVNVAAAQTAPETQPVAPVATPAEPVKV